MATLLLSAAGAALGAGFGGTVLGMSGAVIGRAIGATIGRVIDQRVLGAGSEPVEIGRLDRLRVTGASDGAAIANTWGRVRIAGQVVWASQFLEHAQRRSGGKGGGPSVTEFSYTVSLAVGLCAGEILSVGRIWADGMEVAEGTLNLKVYTGGEDQLPDPKMEAVEGTGMVPAYRGLAYVVIEDLDLSPYGNRVPQFTFEVIRAAKSNEPTLADVVKAVALIPGTGEYALATTPVHFNYGPGVNRSANINSASGRTDFLTSLGHLTAELPQVESVSLVVSWFGDDLRCGHCTIRPKVEQTEFDAQTMPWSVSSLPRANAQAVPRIDDNVIYGGTPADAAVVEAIRAIRDAGREVMFYPFILMDQLGGNTLADPWSDAEEQPALPWRGRISTSVAPGRAGSLDGTAAAETEVAAFFGTASAADFSVGAGSVSYTGPEEWSFRRFVLHYAHLCAVAGGVDAFCIGSELPGLTRVRDASHGFPAVAALCRLAADVRSILGPQCKITYAADWTEYGTYQIDGNLYFPLDPLWADPAIDFVGIDNYMPLSDWRDVPDHVDATWGSIYDLGYLTSNVMGGEGFDWYYDSPEGEAAQIRRPIEDGAEGEPWVFRCKDLRSWWSNLHHQRIDGVRQETPTAWTPGSKPIRFTEYGCPAVDKGTNHPNRFVDIRSSESALPRASRGDRDDLIQMQYFRALAAFWGDPANNPAAVAYQGRMIDLDRCHAWAWDSRPFPAFPGRTDLWSDGISYGRGHWLNGRATNQPLGAVLSEICNSAGVTSIDTSKVFGLVRGYHQNDLQSARAMIQPLLMAFGVDPVERGGLLRFIPRQPGVDHVIALETLAVSEDLDGNVEHVRAIEPELTGQVRLSHIESEGDYEIRTADARVPDETLRGVSVTDLPLVLTSAEAKGAVQRWLAEARIGRDTIRLALPPSQRFVGAGDRIALPDGSTYRVDRVELGDVQAIDAVRIEGQLYERLSVADEVTAIRPFVAPVPAFPVFLDLPLMTGTEVPHAPHVAVSASPWPGSISIWSSVGDSGFELNRLLAAPSIIGVTETPLDPASPGRWDRGLPLRIRIVGGRLESAALEDVLNGRNSLAIGDGSTGNWEILQYSKADLVGPDTYEIGLRLRGQLGTAETMPPVWPVGSTVVVLDRSLTQLDLAPSARGLVRAYKVGPTARGYDDPVVVTRVHAFDGIGLRPYSVSHLRASGRAGAPVRATWIRRTRIDGDSWAALEVPLGEESESYLVRILKGESIRKEYVVSSPVFDYTAQAQGNDGVSGAFGLAVAQISGRFGPGPFRRIDIAA